MSKIETFPSKLYCKQYEHHIFELLDLTTVEGCALYICTHPSVEEVYSVRLLNIDTFSGNWFTTESKMYTALRDKHKRRVEGYDKKLEELKGS